MADNTVLRDIEEAPHIELNQDGSSIDLSNWNEPANRNWSYRHAVDVFPFTKKVSRGIGPVQTLGDGQSDLSSVTVQYRNRDMLLDEYLKESHCDAFVVLKGNDVVYENYRRMARDEYHLCQSVSKTAVCAVISDLIADGRIDPLKCVDEYMPDVAGGFSGVRIQDLLDMNVALQFSEDFTDPDAEIFEYEMITGWHPDAGGQVGGLLPYISGIDHDREYHLDGVTHYLCPNTDMLGCIVEKVTGKRFTDLFAEKIYQHIGAEADAHFATDSKGMAICSGGLIIRPLDLARYGLIFANRGVAPDGARVIPESWIEDCLDQGKGTDYYVGQNYRYHNQMTSNGEAFCHLGVGGQMIYANTKTRVVVVQFSTTSSPSNGDLDVANALYDVAEAVNATLA